MERTKIKICGLTRPQDIQYVNEAKPDFCGFVINVPKSSRNTTPDQVRSLVKELDDSVIPVGVFVNEPLDSVEALLRDGTIKIAQLHGSEDEVYIQELKRRGNYTLIKAFNEKTISQAQESSADYVLLDHGSGGSGETFSWDMAQKITRPYFLAGGLGPDNIEDAIAQVRPWAVDLSSKVETDKRKDREKILAAVACVRK